MKIASIQCCQQNDDKLSSLSMKDVVHNIVNQAVSARANSHGVSRVADQKRQQYSAAFKSWSNYHLWKMLRPKKTYLKVWCKIEPSIKVAGEQKIC